MRYRAVAMDFAAYLDEQYVELRIRTGTGKTVIVVCDKDSIFSVQRHIEQMARACPEISTWKPAKDVGGLHGNERRAYEAAMREGWPVLQQTVLQEKRAGPGRRSEKTRHALPCRITEEALQ